MKRVQIGLCLTVLGVLLCAEVDNAKTNFVIANLSQSNIKQLELAHSNAQGMQLT